MKRLSKLMLMLAIAVTVVFASASIAMADNLKMASEESNFNFKQTACSTTSASFAWNNATVEGEEVYYWAIWDGLNTAGENELAQIDATKSSFVFDKSSSGICEPLYLVYYGTQDGIEGYYYCDYVIASTKFLKSDFTVSNLYSSSLSFSVADTLCSGAKVEVRKLSSGTLVGSSTFTKTSSKISISKNIAYKYRVRPYYVDENGKKYYGPWSSYKYFDRPTSKWESSSAYNGCKIKLKGVKGVSSYRIYVSSTGEEGTFKKTKTVKPSVGKTVSYNINKIGSSSMKKNRTYYVEIVPVIKNTESVVIGNFNFINNYY